jgi:hypothetical protein
LKAYGQDVIEQVAKNAMQVNTAEDYISRLSGSPRRNQELLPLMKAINGQFVKDNETLPLDLSNYELEKESGTTRYYKVSEKNSKVEFNVDFYFYGGIISGWSVEPETESYIKYKSNPGK